MLALLSYPSSFYPRSERDIYDYSKTFCDSVDLATMLFPVPLWVSSDCTEPRSVSTSSSNSFNDVPNVVAIKAEAVILGGRLHAGLESFGGAGGRHHAHHRAAIPLAALVPMQVIATSNTSTTPRAADDAVAGT